MQGRDLKVSIFALEYPAKMYDANILGKCTVSFVIVSWNGVSERLNVDDSRPFINGIYLQDTISCITLLAFYSMVPRDHDLLTIEEWPGLWTKRWFDLI